MSSTEVRKVLMETLGAFVSFCKEHDLEYFLAYGSLLGAVRDQNMIPWDDDIDILMPRPEYDRFLELYRAYPPRDTTILVPGDDDYPTPFAKIINTRTRFVADDYYFPDNYGVCIDIFPLDGAPRFAGGLVFSLAAEIRGIMYRRFPYLKPHLVRPSQTPVSLLKKGAWHMLKAPKEFPSWLTEQFRELRLATGAVALRRVSRRQLAAWADKVISVAPLDRAPAGADMVGWHEFSDALIDRRHLDNFEQVQFGPLQVRTFFDPEPLLAQWYGDDWNIPNPEYKDAHGRAYWRNDPPDTSVEQHETAGEPGKPDPQ